MRLTPLVLHAAMVLPRYTDLFSDVLPVASIAVVAGGTTTITTTTSHGVPLNTQIAVSVLEADTPNAITAVSVSDGIATFTTAHEHDLSAGAANGNCPFSTTVKLAGFTAPAMNAVHGLVSTPSPTTFSVPLPAGISSITLNGAERILEAIDGEIVGWHAVAAATGSTLTFPTPASVTRSFSAENIRVVRRARIFGALDVETALAHFTRDNAIPDKAHLFICPQPVRALGKPDLTDGASHFQQMLDDGFIVLVLMASKGTSAHVAAIDLAQGPLFKAILRAFYGLRVARPELAAGGDYIAMFESHVGGAAKSNAIYGHQYVFSVPAYLTSADAMKPWESGVIDVLALDAAQQAAQASGNPIVLPPNLVTTDSPRPFRNIDFTAILHDGEPQPLSGEFEIGTT